MTANIFTDCYTANLQALRSFTQSLSRRNYEGGGGEKSATPLFFVPENGVFLFFLSLHHPNNRLENIFILQLPLFNSVAQKVFLDRDN